MWLRIFRAPQALWSAACLSLDSRVARSRSSAEIGNTPAIHGHPVAKVASRPCESGCPCQQLTQVDSRGQPWHGGVRALTVDTAASSGGGESRGMAEQPDQGRTIRQEIARYRQRAVERSRIGGELRRQADAERQAGDAARAVEAYRRANGHHRARI